MEGKDCRVHESLFLKGKSKLKMELVDQGDRVSIPASRATVFIKCKKLLDPRMPFTLVRELRNSCQNIFRLTTQ